MSVVEEEATNNTETLTPTTSTTKEATTTSKESSVTEDEKVDEMENVEVSGSSKDDETTETAATTTTPSCAEAGATDDTNANNNELQASKNTTSSSSVTAEDAAGVESAKRSAVDADDTKTDETEETNNNNVAYSDAATPSTETTFASSPTQEAATTSSEKTPDKVESAENGSSKGDEEPSSSETPTAATPEANGETTNSSSNNASTAVGADDKLNAAYEALEKMRKLNLEVMCSESGIVYDEKVHAGQCKTCLVEHGDDAAQQQARFPRIRRLVEEASKQAAAVGSTPTNSYHGSDDSSDVSSTASSNTPATTSRFPRLQRLVQQHQQKKAAAAADTSTTPSPPTKPQKTTQRPQCLICGTPACRSHSSSTFRKENNITVCLECEKLFDMNFVVDCLLETDSRQRRAQVHHLLDSYDRALLLLKYSRQFMLPTAASLDQSTELQNKVGLGSSGVGIASGVLGIAAAATILTPAGPPLLIASLLFGGSATAVQTGTEAYNYFSEPNQLADRILALNGVRLSILRIVSILRDAMLLDHIRSDQYDAKSNSIYSTSNNSKQPLLDAASRGSLLGGLTVGRYGMAGVEASRLASVAETGTLAGRNARFFSRTGSNLMRTARFARFAGGALSAAILVLEAKNMKNTIQNVLNGNPCEKADMLRAIHDELSLPSDNKANVGIVETHILDEECEMYLKTMDARQRALTEEEVSQLLVEQSEAAFAEAQKLQQQQQQQLELVQEGQELQAIGDSGHDDQQGMLILDGEEEPPHHLSSKVAADDNSTAQSSISSASNNNMSLSLLARIELHKQREHQADDVTTTIAASTSAPAAQH